MRAKFIAVVYRGRDEIPERRFVWCGHVHQTEAAARRCMGWLKASYGGEVEIARIG